LLVLFLLESPGAVLAMLFDCEHGLAEHEEFRTVPPR
jgi:hypothetical protein